MNTWVAAISALIALIAGLFLGRKTKRPPKVPDDGGLNQAKDVINEHAEKVEQAGEDLADAMADTPRGRIDRILEWYRNRTGK